MLAHFIARRAVVRSTAAGRVGRRGATFAAISAVCLALGSCAPPAAPLAGTDPADPAATVAAVGYRSTIAPYTRLRPVSPSPWRAQNDRAAPAPKPDR